MGMKPNKKKGPSPRPHKNAPFSKINPHTFVTFWLLFIPQKIS